MTGSRGKRVNVYARDYVVFDLETTGISCTQDAIIEISGIRVRDGKAQETFSTLVNPQRPIPWGATRVNGIDNAMVADAPLLKEALADFLKFAGEDILLGHNIHTFDMKFILDGADRELGRTVENDYIDTLTVAKKCLPELKHHKLTDLAEYYHIETAGAHRALNDCKMNWLCYEQMGSRWQEVLAQEKDGKREGKKVASGLACPECGCLLVKRKGKFGEFWGCTGFPDCRFTKKA